MSFIWWRTGVNLPSIKTLSVVFGDRAREARQLLEGKRKTTDYESVRKWENDCYFRPKYTDRVMLALNEIGGFQGVEYIEEGLNSKSPEIIYLNAGDPYTYPLPYSRERFSCY